jgi:hypothetical protein
MTEPANIEVITLLSSRDGIPTLVALNNGSNCTVHNIAWGYDIGDEHAHVTTNVSPKIDGASIDFFFTSDIQSITDPSSGETLP